MRVGLKLETFSGPDRTGERLSVLNIPDITVFQLSQFIQSSFLAVFASSLKETGGTTQADNSALAANTPQIAFGTGTTAAAYADYAIQTQVSSGSPVSASSSAASSGANTWTITATWNNTTGSSATVSELALYVTSTAGVTTNKTYALTHDEFTGTAVSNGGSGAATLTFTMS